MEMLGRVRCLKGNPPVNAKLLSVSVLLEPRWRGWGCAFVLLPQGWALTDSVWQVGWGVVEEKESKGFSLRQTRRGFESSSAPPWQRDLERNYFTSLSLSFLTCQVTEKGFKCRYLFFSLPSLPLSPPLPLPHPCPALLAGEGVVYWAAPVLAPRGPLVAYSAGCPGDGARGENCRYHRNRMRQVHRFGKALSGSLVWVLTGRTER